MDTKAYPNYFYVWNVKMETVNAGSITYIENAQAQVNAYLDSEESKVQLDGFSFGLTRTAVTEGEEKDFVYSDLDGVIMGDTNTDTEVGICDLVFFNGANSKFKDVRTFDKDYTDELKSESDFVFVVEKIWEAITK